MNALNGGAHRIELFENLGDGGCTPSHGTIKKTMQIGIPTYVMIRPRGGDFVYTNDEIDIMLADIEQCKTLGVNGIVFGCLTSNGLVDKSLCKRLLDSWNGPATFHRAIDRSFDIMQAAFDIVDLGFERILSSGGALNVLDGIPALKKMNSQLGSLITIMPGAGVTVENAAQVIRETGCMELHSTCKSRQKSNNGNLNPMFDDKADVSDLEMICRLTELFK